LAEVKRLLAEDVDPNVADEHHRTALSMAACRGHVAIMDALIASGAWVDPHEDYDVYETPLMAAVIHGQFEAVKVLIHAGANPGFHVGVSQRTAEAYAMSYGHEEIVRYLAGLPQK
jgi:ankyrin repeat protein